MMSNNRGDYASALEWLSVLRKDGLWLSQLQQLQDASADADALCAAAMRKIGQGETFEFWDSYQHQVEPVVMEVWEIRELTLPKLKIQTIGMLSMEWLEQHAETNGTPSEKKKRAAKKSEKPDKPRETMTFGRKSGVTDGHLTLLYQKLVKEEWIEGNEADFKALFSAKRDEDCELTWKGLFGKGTLVESFKQFVAEGLVTVADGFTLPAILEGHFKDADGAWLTGLAKGNSANNKALPIIVECVKLLKASPEQLIYGDYDDDEDFKSEYDPFDHQDLNLHKR
ncbi:MAG: hypothetical protein K6G70_09155 [Bacteroidaceae bacterium]|nr:hypothetical protein [Bacteroidaceae bacterium]